MTTYRNGRRQWHSEDPARWRDDPRAANGAAQLILRSVCRPRTARPAELARLEAAVRRISSLEPRRSRRSSSARPRAANAGAALGSAAATTGTACTAHRAGRPRPTAESRVAAPREAAATGLGSAGAARAAVSAGPRPATAVVAVGLRRRAGRGQCGGANKRSDQPSGFLHLIDPSRQRSCPRLTAATRHEGIDAGRTNSKGVFGIGDEDPQPSRKKERLSL